MRDYKLTYLGDETDGEETYGLYGLAVFLRWPWTTEDFYKYFLPMKDRVNGRPLDGHPPETLFYRAFWNTLPEAGNAVLGSFLRRKQGWNTRLERGLARRDVRFFSDLEVVSVLPCGKEVSGLEFLDAFAVPADDLCRGRNYL